MWQASSSPIQDPEKRSQVTLGTASALGHPQEILSFSEELGVSWEAASVLASL